MVPPLCWVDASSDLRPWLDDVCGAPYDWVVSVEVASVGLGLVTLRQVGEHIPPARTAAFLDNLVRLLARVPLLSHVLQPVHCRWWLSGQRLTLKI